MIADQDQLTRVAGLLNVLERDAPRSAGDGYRPEKFLHVLIEAEKRLTEIAQRLRESALTDGHAV